MIRLTFPAYSNEIYHSAPSGRAAILEQKQIQAASPVSSIKSDRIQISSDGSFKSLLAVYTKAAAHDVNEAVAPERLEALRRQMASDSYCVPSSDLAECMLSRFAALSDNQEVK